MKSLVVYSSNTGNTKKLAQAVYDALSGEKEMRPVEEAPATRDYDLVAVGFWLKAAKPDPKATQYLAGLDKGKRVFLFATHGAASSSEHALAAMEKARGLCGGAEIAGVFSCQGQVSPKVLAKAGAKEHPPVWLKDAPMAEGHPDEGDIGKLVELINAL